MAASRFREEVRRLWRPAALSLGAALVISGLFALAVSSIARERAARAQERAVTELAASLRADSSRTVVRRLRRSDKRGSLFALAPRGASSVRYWSRAGRLLVDAGARPAQTATDEEPAVHRALAGATVTIPAGAGRVLALAPVRRTDAGRVLGALELGLPAARAPASAFLGAPLLLAVLATSFAGFIGTALLAGRRTRGRAAGRSAKPQQRQVDSLTGMPTRPAFRALVEQAIDEGGRRGRRVSVLFIDLNRFKEVNDTLGHHNGDLLLRRVGPRLRSIVREQDAIGRLGGDEFAILMPNLPTAEAAVAASERVHRAFEEPFVLGGLALKLDASVGIAIFPDHGDRVDLLIQRADTAMYAAKMSGSGHAFYAEEQEEGARRRLTLAGDLRRALDGNELVMYYQPKVRLADRTVAGVEALARWEHPVLGTVLPGEFMPIAEQANRIGRLTEKLLETAIGQAGAWRRQGFTLTVAINLATRDLLDVRLARSVERLLKHARADAAWLEFELTEGMLVTDPKRALGVLHALRDVGVRLTVDDFGTGNSSLSYLKDLPVHAIKVDQSFTSAMDEDDRAAAIVRSTIDLGHNLGLEVVAEGVESEVTLEELTALGCDYAQGYAIAPPLPPPDLPARLRQLERIWDGYESPPRRRAGALEAPRTAADARAGAAASGPSTAPPEAVA